MENKPTSDRSQVKRLAKRAVYDRAAINAILDEAHICHVGFVADGQPFVIPTIHVRLGDSIYLHGSVASRMLRQLVGGTTTAGKSPVDDLTDRELEVFRLIGEGHGTRQISDELHLSVKTVETYQSHIKEKLGLRNARELVQYAIQWGITETAPGDGQQSVSGKP